MLQFQSQHVIYTKALKKEAPAHYLVILEYSHLAREFIFKNVYILGFCLTGVCVYYLNEFKGGDKTITLSLCIL